MVDSGAFALSDGDDVLATLGAPVGNPVTRGWRRLGALVQALRGEPEDFVAAAVMTWHGKQPGAELELIAATLLFKDQVVDAVRSP